MSTRTDVETPRTRSYSPTAVLVNLLLGVPGVVPVWLFYHFATNWPLAALGWTSREPTENDGMLPWLMLPGPLVAGSTILWCLANRAVRRRTAPAGVRAVYWLTSVLLTLVPTFVLIIVL
ncbi:hypothetical protein ACIPLC_34510 [Kitasatospora sp. NPDC086801]|uniref:hypothetical protein n=1 Tax=Kitasatospora sp. NPDC086801 TaxID=3364066 RepID=UPI00382B2616